MYRERRYYAVRIGREGPRLYDNIANFRAATLGLSGSSGKGFDNIHDAQDWLTGYQFGSAPATTIHSTTTSHTTNLNVNLNVSNGANDRAETPSSISSMSCSSGSEDDSPWMKQMELIPDELLAQINDVPRPLPAAEPPIELSDEQKKILELVKSGRNIFFTGPAGTGKSVLLRAIINYLRSQHGYNGVAVTAPTGIAGLNIGGQTINSWAGIGFGKEPVEKLKFRISNQAKKRWIDVKTLVIDEVSMLDARLFDKLEEIARFVRRESHPRAGPFGGIQLVASGDFFQLPPVPERDSTSKIDATFAFRARSWSRCIEDMAQLSKVFRQKDNTFIEMLASMRTGDLQDWHIQEFRKLGRQIHYDDGICPTLLFPINAQVDQHNLACINKLSGETRVYKAMDSVGRNIYGNYLTAVQAEKLLDRLVCPKVVPLKVGAQVMLLRNMPESGLVNGSLGKVNDFITVHEAQSRHIAIAKEQRKEGQGAPPTTTNTPGVNEDVHGLIPLDGHMFKKDQPWPLVHFTNGQYLLCSPVEFTVEDLDGNIEARRLQIPLALSWAMSIHKSQGQTLSRVKVDLARIFEKGQAYVAISRATCMEGLEIVNFDPVKVIAHPDVIEWHRQWDKEMKIKMERDHEDEMDSDWAVSQWHSSFSV